MMEANLSAATVPETRIVSSRSPELMVAVGIVRSRVAGAFWLDFAFQYQAAEPETAIKTRKILHRSLRRLGFPVRGTSAGPGTWGAGAG
jgi:hypothetical protein